MTRRTASRTRRRAVHLAAAAVLATAAITGASVVATAAVVAEPRVPVASAPAAAGAAVAARSTGTVVGRTALAGGLPLTAGLALREQPHTDTDPSDNRRWEADVDLGAVPADVALDDLVGTLTDRGFDVRRGSHDVFGARQADGRWQIVVARVHTVGSGEDVVDVLTLGIGSRPA